VKQVLRPHVETTHAIGIQDEFFRHNLDRHVTSPMPPLPSIPVISREPSCVPMVRGMISQGIIEQGRSVAVLPRSRKMAPPAKSERVKFPIYRVVVDWLYTFRV
jgi:hypothetical protein